MCDYSLHHISTRPAVVGAQLVSTPFPGTITRGFCSEDNKDCAVCIEPGTEIAFDKSVVHYETVSHFPADTGQTVARFRQIDFDQPYAHHDALELANGQTVLVTRLREGQAATVLQLPAQAVKAKAKLGMQTGDPAAAGSMLGAA